MSLLYVQASNEVLAGTLVRLAELRKELSEAVRYPYVADDGEDESAQVRAAFTWMCISFVY